MAAVKLRDVAKLYDDVLVIRGLTLEIADGSFVVLVGPSGCGKSTILRMIAGLETISYGDLLIGDRVVNDLEPRDRGIAMVFQSYALYPHLTVEGNLGFGLRIGGADRTVIARRCGEIADLLGLNPYLHRRPSQLSGGQRQRVAIGRAMMRNPEVFLFDEPLSNLDAKLRNQTRIEIKRLQQHLGVTTIYVTHDQVEAMTLADQIVVLRDGEIAQVGTPIEVFERPLDRFVAEFIGAPAMNFMRGTVATDGAIVVEGLSLRSEREGFALPPAGTEVVVGVRPEDIVPAGHGAPPEHGAAISVSVDFVEMLGSESLLYCTFGPVKLTARMSHPRVVERGEHVSCLIDQQRLHVFDASTGLSLRLKDVPQVPERLAQ